MDITGVPGGTDTRNEPKAIFEETLTENFSKRRKKFKPQIQKVS